MSYNDSELQTVDVNTHKASKSALDPNRDRDPYHDTRENRQKRPSDKKGRKRRPRLDTTTKVVIGFVIFLAIVLGLLATFYFYVHDKFRRIEYVPDKPTYEIFTIPQREQETDVEQPTGENTSESGLHVDDVDAEWVYGNAEDFFKSGGIADADYVKNFLLIGTDLRYGENDWPGNSDTNILVSINERTKKVFITSFMRDMYVYIPVRDNPHCDLLNSSHGIGGPQLLMETISGNFKVQIDRYFRVNFYSLIDIIDAAGGIWMDVSPAEQKVMNDIYIYYMCKEAGWENPEQYYLKQTGRVYLTGIQAVAYARVRYVGNADYERTERQRKVISAIADNCRAMSAFQLDAFINKVLPLIATNVSESEIFGLISQAPAMLKYEIVSQRVPFDDTSSPVKIKGKDYILPDYGTNATYLIQKIYATE